MQFGRERLILKEGGNVTFSVLLILRSVYTHAHTEFAEEQVEE